MTVSDGGSLATTQRPWGTQTGSARALLLVLLGEFVWQRHDEVWSATLVEALDVLGASANASRKAMYRSADRGTITPHRHGRRVAWRISPDGDALLREGEQQVFGFSAELSDWDEQWLIVAVSVPESHRHLRHYLRSRLTWAGFGSPLAGLWVSPRTDRAHVVQQILHDLELDDAAYSFQGRLTSLGNEHLLITTAWDIPDLGAAYAAFVARYERISPTDDKETFRSYVEMIQEYRRFPYLDPTLPSEFLPDPWAGREATRFLQQRRREWRPSALRFFDGLQERR